MSMPKEITPQSLAVAASTTVGAMFNGLMFASIAISVFIDQIARDYGWDHARIGGAVTLLYIGMAIGAPVFGKVVDRYGPRIVLLPLTFVSGLILSSFSFFGASLPLFYGAHLLLGIAQPGAVAYSKLLSTWFFRYRGIALTTLGFGTFVAQVALPPVARALQEAFGWHNAYRVLAGAELLVAFPILLLFFRERKATSGSAVQAESHEVRPDGAPAISVRRALTGKTYWLLVGAQVAGLFAFMGVSTHAVGIMSERGVAPDLAIWGLSIFAVGGLVAQLATGFLLDRFDTPRVITPFAVLSLIGVLLLHFAHGQTATLAAILLFGLGCGGQTSMTSYFTTRYFGVRNFSTIYGSLFPILLLFSAPAPVVVGAIFDSTGSYGSALLLLEGLLALTIGFFLLLKPYPYPVKSDANVGSLSPVEPQLTPDLVGAG
jgi:MFS family permease